MKIALYIRVSTMMQFEKGNSVDEQKRRLKAYCESQGWQQYKMFVDAGQSGSNMNRPALQELIEQINNFDMVLVYKLDRLSRKQRDILYLIEDVFLANNVEFNSITESFDTSTPVGRMVLSMMGAFAELERQQIRERTKMGRLASVTNGQWRGGFGVPTGYTYTPPTEGGDRNLHINEYEAQIVRRIFELYDSGYGYMKIVEIINSEFGRKFSGATAIRNILRNETYLGKVKYCGKLYDGNHEAIIDSDLFERVQIKLDQVKNTNPNYTGCPRHLLTGFVRCSCGARVICQDHSVVSKGERYNYHKYVCYSKLKREGMATQDGCDNKPWPQYELEGIIWDALSDLQYSDLQKKDNSSEQKKAFEKELKKVDKQIERLVDLYSMDHIPRDMLDTKLAALKSSRNDLSDKISILNQKSLKMTENEFEEKKNKIDIIKESDLDTQRAFIDSLIKQITLLPNHDLQIEWKV